MFQVYSFSGGVRIVLESGTSQCVVDPCVRVILNPIHAWLILSATLTITLECFLCLCEAVIESYSCIGHSVSHSNHNTRMFSVLV